MASEAENLRRIGALEASVEQLGTQILGLSASIKKLQATVDSIATTVNGMTKP